MLSSLLQNECGTTMWITINISFFSFPTTKENFRLSSQLFVFFQLRNLHISEWMQVPWNVGTISIIIAAWYGLKKVYRIGCSLVQQKRVLKRKVLFLLFLLRVVNAAAVVLWRSILSLILYLSLYSCTMLSSTVPMSLLSLSISLFIMKKNLVCFLSVLQLSRRLI